MMLKSVNSADSGSAAVPAAPAVARQTGRWPEANAFSYYLYLVGVAVVVTLLCGIQSGVDRFILSLWNIMKSFTVFVVK